MSHGWLHRMRSAGVGLAFLAGLVFAGLLHLPNFSSAQQPSTPAVSTPAPTASPAGVAALANLSEAFASVAEHVKPSVVFIKSGDHVKMKKVETGLADNTYIEIKSGIKPGDEVVSGSYTAISRKLKDGAKVAMEKAGKG